MVPELVDQLSTKSPARSNNAKSFSPSTRPQQLIGYSCAFKEINESTFPVLAGLDYNVVTVLGCQSAGKIFGPKVIIRYSARTMLNELFSTNFQVMDASNGIQQTTKGIWMQPISHDCGDGQPKPLVVIDVEGTDSLERGDKAKSFENRSALFSLALGDVVVINVNFKDIGRLVGSNLALLETVLAANYILFQREEEPALTILAIFVRDFPPNETPIERIVDKMRSNLEGNPGKGIILTGVVALYI